MPMLFRRGTGATTTSVAPSYHTISPAESDPNPRDRDYIELGTLVPGGSASASASASNASLPTYADATGDEVATGLGGLLLQDNDDEEGPGSRTFVATQKLRIETLGKPLMGLPVPPNPDPIPIYDVTNSVTCPETPLYVSVRHARNSGTCHLVAGGSGGGGGDNDDPETAVPLCTTTYRFGPAKPPVISLHEPAAESPRLLPPPSPLSSSSSPVARRLSSSRQSDHSNDDYDDDETRSVTGSERRRPEGTRTVDSTFTSPKLLHRTQLLRSPYGTFTWRYAGKDERKALGSSSSSSSIGGEDNKTMIDSLLIMERVVRVALVAGAKKEKKKDFEERRYPVARFVRCAETRTAGSSRSTAGNGGLLELDLRHWADAKDDVEQVRRLVVATCVSMLKKEVDRRRFHQAMVIMAVAS